MEDLKAEIEFLKNKVELAIRLFAFNALTSSLDF